MVKLIFFDYNKHIVTEMANILKDISQSRFIVSDVETLLSKDLKIDVIISPANSFASMGGGIDRVLRNMFSGVETKIQDEIKKKKLGISSRGDPFLPVGDCIIVPTGNDKCKYMASAPTMYLPRNIVGTDNVYKAFLAVLNKVGSIPLQTDITIACCGLGTGIGGLSGTECATQIKKAYNEYYNKK